MSSTVFMFVGLPASGKSTLRANRFPHKHTYINRDSIKSGKAKMEELLDILEAALDVGEECIVLDNTFVTIESRQSFIELANKHGAKIECLFLTTSDAQCQFNACWRMCEKYGKVLRPEDVKETSKRSYSNVAIPPAAFYAMRKRLEEPTIDEGFDNVEKVTVDWNLPKEFVNKAIIVDYDGTLRKTKSGAHYYPITPNDIAILPNAGMVLQEKKAEGYFILGASNQSGVAKGEMTLNRAHSCFVKTNDLMGIDVDYLFDTSRGGPISSWFRKPMPGMGVHFIWKYKLDPSQCIMVGDMTSDKTFAAKCGFQFQWADDFFGRK